MSAAQCSAYRQGGICANGFPQNAACVGHSCHACARPTDKLPACMNEELSSTWLDDSGGPRLYAGRAALEDGK